MPGMERPEPGGCSPMWCSAPQNNALSKCESNLPKERHQRTHTRKERPSVSGRRYPLASQIANRVNEMFYHLASLFQGL